MEDIFEFKHFSIRQTDNPIKVGADGILLGAWADCSTADHILDIGTGTGVIAIIAAHKTQNAKIDAVEIDEISCLEAQHNVSQCPACDRIRVLKTSIQDFANQSLIKYDHILCNPPFFSGGTLTSRSKDSLRQTVKLGHGELLIAVIKLLREGGLFSVILPFMEGLRFAEMASRYNLSITKKVNIKSTAGSSVDRMLLSFVYGNDIQVKTEESDLIIYKIDGTQTDEYQALVDDVV